MLEWGERECRKGGREGERGSRGSEGADGRREREGERGRREPGGADRGCGGGEVGAGGKGGRGEEHGGGASSDGGGGRVVEEGRAQASLESVSRRKRPSAMIASHSPSCRQRLRASQGSNPRCAHMRTGIKSCRRNGSRKVDNLHECVCSKNKHKQTHSSEVQRRAMNAIGALPPLSGQVVKKAARRETAQGTGREAEVTKQPGAPEEVPVEDKIWDRKEVMEQRLFFNVWYENNTRLTGRSTMEVEEAAVAWARERRAGNNTRHSRPRYEVANARGTNTTLPHARYDLVSGYAHRVPRRVGNGTLQTGTTTATTGQ